MASAGGVGSSARAERWGPPSGGGGLRGTGPGGEDDRVGAGRGDVVVAVERRIGAGGRVERVLPTRHDRPSGVGDPDSKPTNVPRRGTGDW